MDSDHATTSRWEDENQPYHDYLGTLGAPYSNLLDWPGYALLPGPTDNNSHASSTIYVLDVDVHGDVSKHEYTLGPFDVPTFAHLQTFLKSPSSQVRERVICVQHILPSVIEALGAALDLEPKVFLQHLGSSWEDWQQIRKQRHSYPVFDRANPEPVSFSPLIDDDSILLSVDFPRLIVKSNPKMLHREIDSQSWKMLSVDNGITQGLHDDQLSDKLADESPEEAGLEEVTQHFTCRLSTVNGVRTSIVFFPPCFQGRFDGFWDYREFRVTPMRPRRPEPKFSSHQKDPAGVKSHLSGHISRTDRADIDSFMEDLIWLNKRPQELSTFYLPWQLMYHYSLGQWQDLCGRLEARYFHLHLNFRGQGGQMRHDLIWYSQVLKHSCLRYQSTLTDAINGIEISKTALEKDTGHSVAGGMWTSLQGSGRIESSSIEQSNEFFVESLKRFGHLDQKLTRIVAKINEILQKHESETQRTIAQTSLNDAKESMLQAQSVKRLTVLAFIWIPVSAISSIFGTNTKELNGDDLPSIWVFFVTALGVTSLVVLSAFSYRFKQPFVEGYKRAQLSYSIISLTRVGKKNNQERKENGKSIC
ncbi:MAG: hypothetical protein M1837_006478 [Sclerophora amabilis]|nr:MAG: hypothetical protein M1837_006478 [Sclerophora amabilis]